MGVELSKVFPVNTEVDLDLRKTLRCMNNLHQLETRPWRITNNTWRETEIKGSQDKARFMCHFKIERKPLHFPKPLKNYWRNKMLSGRALLKRTQNTYSMKKIIMNSAKLHVVSIHVREWWSKTKTILLSITNLFRTVWRSRMKCKNELNN
jgi:hypothetical protein